MKETIISQLEKIANESDFDTKDAIDFIEETDRELESLREKNEDLEDDILDSESKVKKLESKIEDLEEENETLQEENNSLDTRFQIPSGVNDNIVLSGILEDLFSNLSKIPTSDLEEFVKKYSL